MPGCGGIYIQRAGSGSLSVRDIPPGLGFPAFFQTGGKKARPSGERAHIHKPSLGEAAAALLCGGNDTAGYTAAGANDPNSIGAEEQPRRTHIMAYLCVKELFRA